MGEDARQCCLHDDCDVDALGGVFGYAPATRIDTNRPLTAPGY
jgi:hypothetical protein